MKNLLIIFGFLFSSAALWAHEAYPERSSYEIISNVADPKLSSKKAQFVFIINGLENEVKSHRIVYSINKKIDTVLVKIQGKIIESVIPGKFDFKFYYNSQFKEIFIPKTEIKGSYRMTIALYFNPIRSGTEMVKKPIIYLYPEVPTIVEVKVKPIGELTFTYPLYNESWNVLANPSGELLVNDKKYNYLFWESEQQLNSQDFAMTKGSIVSKDSTISFLEKKLTEFGMNSKEQADFITFWGPQLNKNSSNFIHFVINEDADLFAELTISPKPQAVYRIYLVFCDPKGISEHSISEQILPKINRSGFIALEWGGVEIINDIIE